MLRRRGWCSVLASETVPAHLMGALWGAAGEAAFPAWIRQVCRQAREAAKRPPGLYVPLPLLPCAVLEKKKPTRCSSQKRVASLLKLPPGRKSPGKSRVPCRNARGMRLLGKSPGGGSESRVPQVERAVCAGCSASPEDVDNSKLWKVFGSVLDRADPD